MSWQQHAACKGLTDVFFPNQGESAQPAKAICARCPVVDPCRELGAAEVTGVWGGMSGKDRGRRGQQTERKRVHGTIVGYRQHEARDEPQCRDCLDAHHSHEARRSRVAS